MIAARRHCLGALAGAAAGWALPAGGASPAQSPPSSRLPDRPAPPLGTRIALPRAAIVGGPVREPGYWDGKVLVLELWATWCPFCRKQNPLIDQLYRQHAARGLEVLGLAIDDKPELIQRYLSDHGYRFPSTRFDADWWSVLGRPKGLPVVWVVGRDSRLLQVEVGEMFPEDIEQLARWL